VILRILSQIGIVGDCFQNSSHEMRSFDLDALFSIHPQGPSARRRSWGACSLAFASIGNDQVENHAASKYRNDEMKMPIGPPHALDDAGVCFVERCSRSHAIG
jgi:hypothetical protein